MSSSVIIVEDEGIVAMEIKECVEGLGHTVCGIADTGEDAVSLAAEVEPDLVIMDIRLKGTMDGIEAAAKIRENRDIPVIYLTAYSGDTMLDRAKLTEPYGYVLKPVQDQSLESAIRMAVHKHKRDAVRQSDLTALASVVGSIQSGIIVTDTELIVRYMNSQAETFLGVRAERSIGQPLAEAIQLRQSLSDSAVDAPAEAALEGRALTLEGQSILIPGSESLILDLTFAPLRGKDDRIDGVIITLADTRDRVVALEKKKNESELEDEFAPLIQNQEELRSFLEVEIVRLRMGAEVSGSALATFEEGQIAAYKRLLRLIYGKKAVEEFMETRA